MGGFVQDFSECELRNVGNGLCAVPYFVSCRDTRRGSAHRFPRGEAVMVPP